MNKDDIIRMARQSGLADANGVVHAAYQLEAFANLVAAAEREEIAQLADASVNADQYPTLTMLAQAIRMRGD